ncbi:MAG: hypothetical protein HGA85_09310, partial [Nanoarchaeota archaeon]|nr:hypothetical protein [Nanoarchaeota archaeon]
MSLDDNFLKEITNFLNSKSPEEALELSKEVFEIAQPEILSDDSKLNEELRYIYFLRNEYIREYGADFSVDLSQDKKEEFDAVINRIKDLEAVDHYLFNVGGKIQFTDEGMVITGPDPDMLETFRINNKAQNLSPSAIATLFLFENNFNFFSVLFAGRYLKTRPAKEQADYVFWVSKTGKAELASLALENVHQIYHSSLTTVMENDKSICADPGYNALCSLHKTNDDGLLERLLKIILDSGSSYYTSSAMKHFKSNKVLQLQIASAILKEDTSGYDSLCALDDTPYFEVQSRLIEGIEKGESKIAYAESALRYVKEENLRKRLFAVIGHELKWIDASETREEPRLPVEIVRQVNRLIKQDTNQRAFSRQEYEETRARLSHRANALPIKSFNYAHIGDIIETALPYSTGVVNNHVEIYSSVVDARGNLLKPDTLYTVVVRIDYDTQNGPMDKNAVRDLMLANKDIPRGWTQIFELSSALR